MITYFGAFPSFPKRKFNSLLEKLSVCHQQTLQSSFRLSLEGSNTQNAKHSDLVLYVTHWPLLHEKSTTAKQVLSKSTGSVCMAKEINQTNKNTMEHNGRLVTKRSNKRSNNKHIDVGSEEQSGTVRDL